MTDQPERLSTDELPPDCPAWAGALFGELALESDPTSYRVVEARSMVGGESPGPAPAAQARANNWRLTQSS